MLERNIARDSGADDANALSESMIRTAPAMCQWLRKGSSHYKNLRCDDLPLIALGSTAG